MAANGATIAYLAVVFVVGALATTDPRLSLAVVLIVLAALVVRSRFRPREMGVDRTAVGLRPDWILILLPTAVSLRPFSDRGSFLILLLLVAAAFLRKPDGKFTVQLGPLVLLFAASAIVLSRPNDVGSVLTFALISILAVRIILTVNPRRIIASLVDGCGLFLFANLVAYAAGLRAPGAESRIGALLESSGFLRIIFPLGSTLNTPPTIASIFVVAFIFLIWEQGWLRRTLRSICLVAAFIVLISAGTRVPMVAVAGISLAVVCFPLIMRWIGQATVAFAAASAFILLPLIESLETLLAPVLSLIPGRDITPGSIASLNGRDLIWVRSINYWSNWVNDYWHVLFGYGVNGQYQSGASFAYRDFISSIVRRPELASVHNSFLQQLFDGGIIGFALLTLALFWASVRLARKRREWGNWGLTAIVAMTVLVLSGMTEVSLVPGPAQGTFWLLIILVAIACQTGQKDAAAESTAGTSLVRTTPVVGRRVVSAASGSRRGEASGM